MPYVIASLRTPITFKILQYKKAIVSTQLFIILLLLLNFRTYAQQEKLEKFNTVSPNSVKMVENGGAVNSNLYNGSLSVNLPITTFRSRNISIPIEISYNSNGIRINQRPTSVGIGWNINLGGEITRIVRGYPDEKKATRLTDSRDSYYNPSGGGTHIPEIPSYEEPVSYDGSYLAVRHILNSYTGNIQSFIDNVVKPNYDQKIIDLAPDEFIFNFNGISGSFYFSSDGGVKFKSKSGIQFKVEYTLSSKELYGSVFIPRYIESFKLVDNKGVQYFFGGLNAVEYSYPAQDVSQVATNYPGAKTYYFYTPGATVNTWKLVKIIDVDKNQVNLEYKPRQQIIDKDFFKIIGKIGANDSFADGFDVNSTRKAVTSVCLLDKVFDNLGNTLKFNYEVSNSLGSVTTRGSRLTFRTTAPAKNVAYGSSYQYCVPQAGLLDGAPTTDGITAPQLFALKSIVKYYNNEQIESTTLNYRDETDKRLRLSSVSRTDQSSIARTIYQFSYNPMNLPGYTSKKDDFWGYYNGNDFFDYSVEAKNYTYNKINADFINSKQPNLDYTGAELLEKIVFETKGYQQFEFEPNTCFKYFNYNNNQLENALGNSISAGLRVSRIKEFDENDVLLTERRFHYVKNFANQGTTSSGIQKWKTKGFSDYLKNLSDGLTWRFEFGFDYTKIGIDGNVVTYDEVTEERIGAGFKTFFFDNDSDITLPPGPVSSGWNLQELNNYFVLKYGLLRKEEYYDESRLKKYEKTYDYSVNDNEYLPSIAFITPTLMTNVFNHIRSRVDVVFPDKNYTNRIYFHNPLLLQTVTKNFEQGNITIEKQENYTYNDKKLLLESTSSSSIDNDKIKTRYFYPDQFAASGTYWEWVTNSNGDMIKVLKSGTNIYSKMVAANMFNYPIETITSRERLNQSSKTLAGRISIYNDNNPNNLILPERELSYEPFDWQTAWDLVATQPHPTGIIPDSRYKTKIRYNKFDWRGNVLEIQKEFDRKSSYVYSYNGSLPVAEVVNADYTAVEAALGGAYAIDEFSNSNLKEASVMNFVNVLRNTPALKDAQVSTHTYRPAIGVTSKMDPKGMSIHYEYDGFGRLRNVRDSKDNIITSYKYSTASNSVYVDTKADWTDTGLNAECEMIEDMEYGGYMATTGNITKEQRDMNSNSPTYNQTRRIVDSNNTSLTCPASYYFTYTTDPYMSSVSINAKRSYDDNTSKTMRFRVRHDSMQWGSQVIEEFVDIVINSQSPSGQAWLFVNAVSYLEVELVDIF